MRILKEAYTRDEIKQRVVDTRNIISALMDSLSILQSSLLDADPSVDKDECSKLARYTRTYEIDIEDMMTDFSDDFESFLVEKEEEEDFEDDYEYEEEEVVEESLKESWGLPNYQYEVWYTSSSGNDKLLGASDSFENIEDMAIRQMDNILSSPFEDKIDKPDIAKSFRIIDTKIKREIKSDKLEDRREEALEMLLESAKKSLVESEEDIEFIRKVSEPLSDELDELEGDRDEFYVTWNFGLDGQGNITAGVDVNPHPRFNHDPQKIEEIKAKVESAFEHNGFKLDDDFKVNPGKTLFGAIHYQIKKNADNLNESADESLQDKIYEFLDDLGGYADYQDKIDGVAEEFGLDKDTAESYVTAWIHDPETLSESATTGSVEDFFKKMEGKSKAEAEKIVRQAKGNPNADKAYQKYLELTEDTEKVKDGKWVNKGDTGETHGTFATKKEADAQRKAMFANGFKG